MPAPCTKLSKYPRCHVTLGSSIWMKNPSRPLQASVVSRA
jgi:hypothetical protein